MGLNSKDRVFRLQTTAQAIQFSKEVIEAIASANPDMQHFLLWEHKMPCDHMIIAEIRRCGSAYRGFSGGVVLKLRIEQKYKHKNGDAHYEFESPMGIGYTEEQLRRRLEYMYLNLKRIKPIADAREALEQLYDKYRVKCKELDPELPEGEKFTAKVKEVEEKEKIESAFQDMKIWEVARWGRFLLDFMEENNLEHDPDDFEYVLWGGQDNGN